MELNIAIDLIKTCVPRIPSQQLWWDLGAGSGLFTSALANLLGEGRIVAVDKDAVVMKNIPGMIGNVEVEKFTTDFARFTPPGQPNGILMANSLHFVDDKLSFLSKLRSLLLPDGRLIVIEYELTTPNAWVPFPLEFKALSIVALAAGFGDVKKISTTASRFQNNGIYSALLN